MFVFVLFIGGLVVVLGVIGLNDDGYGIGSIVNIVFVFLFVFVCRNLLWVFFIGLLFEWVLFWYKFCVYVSVFVGVWYGYVF